MSTENAPISASALTSATSRLRLSRDTHDALPSVNTPAQTERILPDDPRWVFAMRARLAISSGAHSNEDMRQLVEQGMKQGLSVMQIRAIIGVLERAVQRGGFDLIAHDEIMRIPEVDRDAAQPLSDRARWIVFGALFAWALMIAGLMQLVA